VVLGKLCKTGLNDLVPGMLPSCTPPGLRQSPLFVEEREKMVLPKFLPFFTYRFIFLNFKSHCQTWIFHGDKDMVVLETEAREMENALRASGGTVKFTLFEGRNS
jgi:hypothetical protein